MSTAIEVSGLTMSYADRQVLKGVDFQVKAGEVFCLLGPNGAGKTTTVEILEGFRQRTGGTVSVLGMAPRAQPARLRERIGIVLQECELDPLLTVREAISLFATFYPTPRPVEETIELTGLAEKREARIGSLSGGQKRRVDVAIGIIGDPDLIFLDEPTTGFDPTARRDAWNMIEGLKALGKTVFLTTHYMDEAEHLADRVAILREGHIVAQGPMKELSASLGRRTVIGFRLNGGLDVEDVRSCVSATPQAAGDGISIETEQPQSDLYRLLALAEQRGVALEDLEVRKPSLEDIFLDLTRDQERQP